MVNQGFLFVLPCEAGVTTVQVSCDVVYCLRLGLTPFKAFIYSQSERAKSDQRWLHFVVRHCHF